MRVASSVVMVVLAIAAVAVGGWPFVLFWTAAAVIIAWEWTSIVAGDARLALAVAVAALIAAAAAAGFGAALGCTRRARGGGARGRGARSAPAGLERRRRALCRHPGAGADAAA